MYYAEIEWKEERRGLVKLEAKTKEEIAYDIADELYELKEILITLDEVDIERRKRILKKIDAFHINTDYYENGGFELVEMYRKENENLRR